MEKNGCCSVVARSLLLPTDTTRVPSVASGVRDPPPVRSPDPAPLAEPGNAEIPIVAGGCGNTRGRTDDSVRLEQAELARSTATRAPCSRKPCAFSQQSLGQKPGLVRDCSGEAHEREKIGLLAGVRPTGHLSTTPEVHCADSSPMKRVSSLRAIRDQHTRFFPLTPWGWSATSRTTARRAPPHMAARFDTAPTGGTHEPSRRGRCVPAQE